VDYVWRKRIPKMQVIRRLVDNGNNRRKAIVDLWPFNAIRNYFVETMRLLLQCFLLFACLISCIQKEKQVLKPSDFKVHSAVEYEKIEVDVYAVHSLGVIGEDYLLVTDKNSKLPFYIFSLDDFTVSIKGGSIGDGPSEFGSPTFYGAYSYTYPLYEIEVVDRRNQRLNYLVYDVENDSLWKKDYYIPFSPDFVPQYEELFSVDANSYFVNSTSLEGKYFYENLSKRRKLWMPFQPKLSKLPLNDQSEIGQLYHSHMAKHPDSNMVVSFYTDFNKFEIINTENQEIIKEVRLAPYELQKIANLRRNPNGGLPSEIEEYFFFCTATSNYIYSTYTSTRDDFFHLLVFDWSGNPVADYTMEDVLIGRFTVDEKRQRILGQNWDHDSENYPIISISLKHF
jgi:hypothetical protein